MSLQPQNQKLSPFAQNNNYIKSICAVDKTAAHIDFFYKKIV